MKKVLMFFCGFIMGFCYIVVFFGGIGYLCFRLFSNGMSKQTSLVLMAVTGVIGIAGFFILSYILRRFMKLHSLAFPLGSFLCADALVASVPMFDLLQTERLISWANGSKETAKAYASGIFVLLSLLLLLVLSWLIYMLFTAFKRFQKNIFDRAVAEAAERMYSKSESSTKPQAEHSQSSADTESKQTKLDKNGEN